MTSWETGERIRDMYQRSDRRRAYQPVGAKRKSRKSANSSADRKARRQLVQLVICGSVFVLLVAVKLLIPAKIEWLSQRLTSLMSQNMDIAEVFSAVGRGISGETTLDGALNEVYQAVFAPEQISVVSETLLAQPGFSLRSPLEDLRTFADGEGNSTDWLMDPAKAVVDAGTESGSQGETMNLSYILYSEENLPANVSMQQAILDFSYCTPVVGTLSSDFGYREHPVEGEERFHYGVDLAANTGTEIDCFADGTVTAVGESSSYGKYLTVSHSGGYSTLYAHCSKITVSSGAAVKKGQKIAEVGETGIATGPHLHFEIHCGNDYLNPIYYVTTA